MKAWIRRVFIPLGWSVAALVAGCGGGGSGGLTAAPAVKSPAPASTHKVSGTITHYQKTTPLSGVTVTVSTATGDLSAVTDANGFYTVPGIADGDHRVTVALAGNAFFPPNKVVAVSGGDSSNNDFTYTDRFGRILGLITDAGGIPYSPVNIAVYSDGVLFTTLTNEPDGSLAIGLPPLPPATPPKTYSLLLTRTNFVPLRYDNIQIKEGEDTFVEMMPLIHTSFSGRGDVAGRIKNALTGSGVNGLTVSLRSGINVTSGPVVASTTTFQDGATLDPNGAYTFVNPVTGAFTIPGGNYTAEVSGPGYNSVFFSVKSLGGMITAEQNMTIAPVTATDLVRIVLTWGVKRDLDSHLTGPTEVADSRFHVYYPSASRSYADSVTDAKLDVDNVVAYGPETTTIVKRAAGTYRFSVHDFTGKDATTSSALSTSGAQVRVYKGNDLLQTFNAPVGRLGTLWTVFEIDGTNATLTPINRMTYHSNPASVQ